MDDEGGGCYFGIFDFYGPSGLQRTLVMSGTFTPGDLERVNICLVEEGVF